MVFSDVEGIVDFMFKKVSYKLVDPQVQSLVAIMGIVFTLYIMYHGYMILAGKTESPIKPLIWKLVVMMLFITVAANGDGLMDAVVASVNGLVQWAGGDVSLYTQLDKLLVTTNTLANTLYDKGSYVTGSIAYILVYLGFIIGAVPAFLLIIYNSISLKFLLMVAPLMIFSYVFGWTKSMFFNWLSMILANILVVLFIGTFIETVNSEFIGYINAHKAIADAGGDYSEVSIAIQVLILGFVLTLIVMIAKTFAEKLASLSLDGEVHNQIKNGADKFRRKK